MKLMVIPALVFSSFAAFMTAQERSAAAPLCAGANAPAPSAGVQSEDFIEVRRTACYGTCPVYSLRLYADGRLAWRGEHFVKMVGEASGRIPTKKATAVLEAAREAGFWTLCSNYTANVTDQPTTVTSLRIDGQLKRVDDYGRTAPLWLRDLDTQIDAFTAKYRWRKIP